MRTEPWIYLQFILQFLRLLNLSRAMPFDMPAPELNKYWNDSSSIRSDLRVNPRWRKLTYDNYEGRKQT